MEQAKSGNGKSPLFERVMMRCTNVGCHRWVSVGPSDSHLCPSCAISGLECALEPVDHAAHMASLPKSENDPADVAKYNAALLAKKADK